MHTGKLRNGRSNLVQVQGNQRKEAPGWCGARVGLVGLTFVAFDFVCEKLTGRIINGDHLTVGCYNHCK